ncbi:hypothetical protein SAMN04487899_105185 [Segatella bryantii]|jgi:hypothetical protein|uniref:Lipoprotein n=1 Tax=Segatella bryantii TaxID=77095 RepID=A0ABX4ENI6_SEGBR|nr:hypothetical protein CIK91_07015 [Segatella bryantii]SDL74116.1 hypothetical protein SAMN04487899_105185 [Segatella bryantii]
MRYIRKGSQKSKKQIIYLIITGLSLISCRQSLFEVITHNNVGYWSRYDNGVIMEYSKRDSTIKYLDDDWTYHTHVPQLWGLKFKITNDTMFFYTIRRGNIIMVDTTHIVGYNKNTLFIKNKFSEDVIWHRRIKKRQR